MTEPRNIHFVGSIGLEDTETVFRTLAEQVGTGASRYPDGETGVRTNWIIWQGAIFAEHADFEPAKRTPLQEQTGIEAPFRLRDTVDPKALTFETIGYAEEALRSYETFCRLRAEGVIPQGVRFQVSLPTPFAVVGSFVAGEQATSVEPSYEAAMSRVTQTLVDKIPNEDLAIQWDIAHEVVGFDRGPPLYRPGRTLIDHATKTVTRLSETIPKAVQVGLHLCYGDPGHKHVVEPKDAAVLVQFANAIISGCPRRIDWVHMPVPRDRSDDAYFAPLTGLDIGATELVIGLVHYTDGEAGTRARLGVAEKYIQGFSIATECGFGRRPAQTIPDLLRIHVAVA